jgi:hypothetical protein
LCGQGRQARRGWSCSKGISIWFKATHEDSDLPGSLREAPFLEFMDDAPGRACEPVLEGRCRKQTKPSLQELDAFGVLPGHDPRAPCLQIEVGGSTASASFNSARQFLQTVGAFGKLARSKEFV